MAKSSIDNQISQLYIVSRLLYNHKPESKLKASEVSAFQFAVSKWGLTYGFSDYTGFIQKLPVSAVDAETQKLESQRLQEDQEVKEEVESSTIPPDLEGLVAQYEENLEERNKNDGSAHTVAESVKRAREAMLRREKIAAIQRNRAQQTDDPDGYLQKQDKRSEELLVKFVDPKVEDPEKLLADVHRIVSITTDSYIDSYIDEHPELDSDDINSLRAVSAKVVNDTTYLGLTAAVDLSNPNDLITAIDISIHNNEPFPLEETPITQLYQKLDEESRNNELIDQKINENEIAISELRSKYSSATNDSEKDEIESRVRQLESANQRLETAQDSLTSRYNSYVENQASKIETTVAVLTSGVNATLDRSISEKLQTVAYLENQLENATDPEKVADIRRQIDQFRQENPEVDLETLRENVDKRINTIHDRLSNRDLITPSLPGDIDSVGETETLEGAIRSSLPNTKLRFNATYEGSETATLLSDPSTRNKKLSPKTVDLYSKGLSIEDLDKIYEKAKSDPKSALGQLYLKDPKAFEKQIGTLRKQFRYLDTTVYNQAVKHATANPNSALGKLYSSDRAGFNQYIRLINKSASQKELNAHLDKLGVTGQVRRLFNRDFKKNVLSESLGGQIKGKLNWFEKRINPTLNRLTTNPFIRKYGKFIFDPQGAITDWAGKKAGQWVLNKVVAKISNTVLRKTLDSLISVGLKETVNKLMMQLAMKMALKVGLKVALQTAAQALNAIPGLGVVVAIAIELVSVLLDKLKKVVNDVFKELTGEDISVADIALVPAVVIGSAVAFSAGQSIGIIAAIAGIVIIAYTSYTAIFAAIGVSAIVISTFFIITNLMGPIISGFAQLSYIEGTSVASDCAAMPWPFDGTYRITQGPNVPVCTHHGSIAQSADFSVPLGTPIKSMTNGTVIIAETGSSGYGNYVEIDGKTDSGQSFKIIYGHFSSLSVRTGDQVTAGQEIGLSGSTGYSTGPHLHLGYFGINYNSCPAGGFKIIDNCCIDAPTKCNQP